MDWIDKLLPTEKEMSQMDPWQLTYAIGRLTFGWTLILFLFVLMIGELIERAW